MKNILKIEQPLRGALLIGGKSKRMGTPKSLLSKGSSTLGVVLAELLTSELGPHTTLVGQGPMGKRMSAYPRVSDHVDLQGPLSGIVALHIQYPTTPFIILAVDLAFFEKEALRWLVNQARRQPEIAIWPKLEGRNFGEPLASYYPASALSIMMHSAKLGERALHRALPITNRTEPLVPDYLRKAFTNVNRPEDLPRSKADP